MTGPALDGRRALVTGAGNGLGRAIALALAAAGARTVLVGRDAGRLGGVADEIGPTAEVRPADVSDPGGVEALRVALRGDEPDILVNNAGIPGPVADLVDIDPADWDEVFAVNVRGPFLMCRAFAPAMIARGSGDIVTIASVTGKRPLAGRTPYAASKTALHGMTATLAVELGGSGVRVNTVSPGPVDGERMRRNFRLEASRTGRSEREAETEFVSRSAMRRMVTEEEVAAAVLAVLGMTGMTGADVDLSGGMIAR